MKKKIRNQNSKEKKKLGKRNVRFPSFYNMSIS